MIDTHDIERALVARLLIEPEGIGAAESIVSPQHFADAGVARVYSALLDVRDNSPEVDPVLVVAYLRDSGVSDAQELVASIVESGAAMGSVDTYARKVREAAARRELAVKLDIWRQRAKRGELGIDALRTLQAEIAELSAAVPADDGDMQNAVAALEAEFDEQGKGNRSTLDLPWPRLSHESRALRPRTVCLLGGPPGTGKSFFTITVALSIRGGWRYLPLEDNRTDLLKRVLAVLCRDYAIIDDDPDRAGWRREKAAEHRQELEAVAPWISENPRVGKRDGAGRVVVPPLPHTAILEWVEKAVAEGARAVFVDPISQIEFSGRRQWEVEADFMRSLLALVAGHETTVFLVAHTRKRPGQVNDALSLEDFQGSAMFGRLCHSAMLLDAHEWRTSRLFSQGGAIREAYHNRTVTIAKARFGGGTRKRIAFVQESDAPQFVEEGVIAPKGADGRAF